MNSKKWIKIFLIFSITPVLFLAGFNWLVDPYSVFQNSNIGKYRTNEITSHLRLFKAIAIRHQSADILLFGDSQIEHGINSDILSKETNMTVFNASFSSMTIYEFRKYLEVAIKTNKPKVVVAGLQMYDFTSKKYNDDYKDEYLSNKFYTNKIIFSLDTTKSSSHTLKSYFSKKPLDRLSNGLWIDDSKESYHKRFIANEKHYIYDNAPLLHKFNYDDNTSTFIEYKKILELCHENNIKLILFISPSHARQWEATAVGNGWKTFEEWKRKLVFINEQVAKEQRVKPFDIWDFSGYYLLTTEEIPTKSNVKMKYYYESSHYTPALGNIVLDRMFDGNYSGGQNYPDFGVKITSQNIEAHLSDLRIQRAKYKATHPKDITEIEAFTKEK